jgi:anti-sigma-K factor RskA
MPETVGGAGSGGPGELEDAHLEGAGLEALAETLATPPPAALRARVLDAVRREAADARRLRRVRSWRGASLLGLAASALLGLLYALETLETRRIQVQVAELTANRGALEVTRDELIARLEAQQAEVGVMEEAFAVQQEVVRILSSPRLVTALLAGEPGGSASARVLLDPATGRVAVIGSGLPPPQAGRVYAVWAIREDGTPEPAGVLTPAGGRAFAVRMHEVVEPRAVAEFAISIEPSEGAAAPTGPVILAGAVTQPQSP